jgi:CHAT domain-containing protein
MRTRYLGGLGEAYRFLGDVNQAIAHLEQALALVREKGDTEMEIRFLTGDTEMEISFLTLEGDIYSELGDLRRGIENYRKALEIAGKAGDRRRQARLLSTLGTTYSWLSLRTLGSDPPSALASLKEAERFCRQALTLAEETDYKEIKVRCLVDLGAIYTLLPHTWLQGEDYLRRALAMARDYGYRLLEGNALAILASRYQVRRELTKALACYQEALAIAQTHAMPHLCWKCKRGIGLCYRTQGKPESAMACLLSAMDDVERIGSSIPIERLEAAYFETVRDVYHDALSLALEQDQVEVAIEIAERSKARSLIQLLTNRGIKPRPRTTDVPGMQELVAEERRLWESITVLRRRLLGEGSRGEPRAAAEEEELLSQLEVLERQYGEVFDKMRLTNPSYASLVKPSKFSLAQFRQALKAKLTPHFKGTWHCVEYYLLDERLLGFYMNDNEARVIVDKHLDERKRRRLDIALDHSSCRTFYHRQDTEDLAELYNLLVPETLTTKLGEDDLLIISPHGELHFLPFHALYDTSRQRYLVQQVSVSYTPNLYTLQLLLKGADFAPPQRPLLLGNPTFPHPKLNLPFAEQEALKLHKKVYRGCGRLLLREKASAEAISAMQRSGELLNYDVLHFASHALYDGQNPLMSGVLLYDERRKSFAILDVAQIFDLCLKAKIVSLSACQSGLAEVLGGDQIVGLSTAFLYAGAETIVASLWQVGDEATFELMTDFHRRLRAGVGRSRALREAQVAMINEGKTPFQWACFEVIGVP